MTHTVDPFETAADVLNARQQLLDKRTPAQLASIARIKRFHEWFQGAGNADKTRTLLRSDNTGVLDMLSVRHDVNVRELRPIWDSSIGLSGIQKSQWPLVDMYVEWLQDGLDFRARLRGFGSTRAHAPIYDNWRNRQITRLKTELPQANSTALIYPILAFELSEGCSVGCSFCGLSASRLASNLDYATHGKLWREILVECVAIFGPAAATMVCYWATEPLDNPHYVDYITDAWTTTGLLPPTTTATPLRDIAKTRELLSRAKSCGYGQPRFSVLSRRQLQEIHDAFTPDELLEVTVINQTRATHAIRAPAGRAFKPGTAFEHHATIACVAGFLVNMVKRSVSLVAPCLPSTVWPNGYRIIRTAAFNSAEEFAAAVRTMINDDCSVVTDVQKPLRFRADLRYSEVQDGFQLLSAGVVMTVNQLPGSSGLGQLISTGLYNVPQLVEQVSARTGDALGVSVVVSQLRSMELLENS